MEVRVQLAIAGLGILIPRDSTCAAIGEVEMTREWAVAGAVEQAVQRFWVLERFASVECEPAPYDGAFATDGAPSAAHLGQGDEMRGWHMGADERGEL